MKDHLRITGANEDALIAGALVAAVRAVEARASLAFMPQTWRVTIDAAPAGYVSLPISPASAVDAVRVKDGQGGEILIDPDTYEFAPGAPGKFCKKGPWPSPGTRLGGVSIDFTAGYAGGPPEPLNQAVMLLAAHFYENREAAGEARIHTVPQAVDALIAPYRQVRL